METTDPNISDISEKYISVLVTKSKHYRELINEARTKLKIKYYEKKLNKNNKELTKAISLYSTIKNMKVK